jgi:hypothetical protein
VLKLLSDENFNGDKLGPVPRGTAFPWFPNSCLGSYLHETLFRASRRGPRAKQSFAKERARTELGHEVKSRGFSSHSGVSEALLARCP